MLPIMDGEQVEPAAGGAFTDFTSLDRPEWENMFANNVRTTAC